MVAKPNHLNSSKDILDQDYPIETLTEDARLKRQEIIDKINTYGKKVERYSEETVRDIWADIFVNNLDDNKVAEKYGCAAKYSWKIRHDRIRKALLRRIRMEYFDKLFAVQESETESAEAVSETSSIAIDEETGAVKKKSRLIVTCAEDDGVEDFTPEFDDFDSEESREAY